MGPKWEESDVIDRLTGELESFSIAIENTRFMYVSWMGPVWSLDLVSKTKMTIHSVIGMNKDAVFDDVLLIALEGLQEDIQEDRYFGFPSNFPECQLHPGTHPLEATVNEGTVRWICPKLLE